MTTLTTHLRTPLFHGLRGKLDNLTHGLRRWNDRRRAIAQLRELPDYLLDDLGIVRSEIPETVDGLMHGVASR